MDNQIRLSFFLLFSLFYYVQNPEPEIHGNSQSREDIDAVADNKRHRIEMLTIERCKEILGERGTHLSDEQVLNLRDSLCSIVNLIFDNIEKKEVKKSEQDSCSSTKAGEASPIFVGVQTHV